METAHHVFWGHGHWFWIVPALFMILMLACVVRMLWLRRSWRWGEGRRMGPGAFGWCCCGGRPTSRRTNVSGSMLDERRATDEISKEPDDRMRRTVASNRAPST